jgi:hypothetical protein
LVNKQETLVLFDQEEDFSGEFLHVTTNEVRKFLEILGFDFPQFTFEINMVRQYAN